MCVSFSFNLSRERSKTHDVRQENDFARTIYFEDKKRIWNSDFSREFRHSDSYSKTIYETFKRSNSQTYCLYSKDKFNKKLDRFEKKLLVAASIDAVTAENHEKFMKNKIEYILKKLKKRVFEVYHNEIEMFMRIKVDELASHRKKDHEINLKLEIESSLIKNYRSMSNQELIAMRKYLEKHLTKDFIRFSSSKTIASILLMKKSKRWSSFLREL
jgi:hypothetical protein